MVSERLNSFIAELQTHEPKLRLAYKDESLLMKLIGKILFFNPKFMTGYITTLGNTIYFPSRANLELDDVSPMLVICHEFQHIQDSKRLTQPVYSFVYLFPQILALLALIAIPLAFLVAWQYALIPLLALLCLLPIPAYGRMKLEFRGYSMSLFALSEYLRGTGQESAYITGVLSERANMYDKYQFKGAGYYFMWPFGVRKELGKVIEQIRISDGDISDETYRAVSAAIRKFNTPSS